ncbi:MAG: tetratricopeptide repeat protein, partial [Haloechinothrix sp.]
VAETEGVPYFLVEYLAVLADSEAQAAGVVPVPRGVRSLLRSRVASVSQAARQILSAAAVIGRSFDVDLVRETSGRGEEETVSGVEELTARGLVREAESAPEAAYDFTHDQLRQLVHEETSLPRRRLLHRRAAEALARRSRPALGEGRAAVIAEHYRAAGDDRAAAHWFLGAGDASRRVYANADALAHYRSALALGGEDSAALHEAIGDLETLAGDYETALADYEAAAASASVERQAGLEHKLGTVHERRGAWALAETHLSRALQLLPDDAGSGRPRVLADLSLNTYRQGARSRATAEARQALRLATDAGDLLALAQVHNLLGILSAAAGRHRPARRHFADSLHLAEQLANPAARIAALNNLALAERQDGKLERAIELTRTALDACARLGDRHREAALRNNLADLLHQSGRHEPAMEELKKAVAIFAEIGQGIPTEELQPEIWKLVEW